jgi:hypothetical protein
MNVKRRNMVVQVLLMIVTFGLYSVYWFYQTSKELKFLGNDANAAPGLWTVLLFIPLVNLYSIYKHSELFQHVGTEHINRWLLFVIWMVFSPATWFIVQSELNQRATA